MKFDTIIALAFEVYIMRSNLIFDVGLHLGEDSEFYLKKGFDVVAVEASPQNAAASARRLRPYIDSGKLFIVNKAIAREEGPITFFASDHSEWGTTDRDWVERNRRLGSSICEIVVPGIPFSNLLREYGTPYYIKIDIERADLLCLEALLDSCDRPKYLSIESSKTSFEELVSEFCLLQRLGYKKYKIVDQSRVREQHLPNPAREGRFVDHVFEDGSSGAFGRELAGEWLTLEQALQAYMRIFKKYHLDGDFGLIARVVRDSNVLSFANNILRRSQVLRRIRSRLRAGWHDIHAMRED